VIVGTFATGQARESLRTYAGASLPIGNFASVTHPRDYQYYGYRKDIKDYETAAKYARKMIRAAV
jgi:hypothetical protein